MFKYTIFSLSCFNYKHRLFHNIRTRHMNNSIPFISNHGNYLLLVFLSFFFKFLVFTFCAHFIHIIQLLGQGQQLICWTVSQTVARCQRPKTEGKRLRAKVCELVQQINCCPKYMQSTTVLLYLYLTSPVNILF